MEELPPVLIHKLIKIRTKELCEIIRPYLAQLEQAGWMAADIKQIEEDHHNLCHAAKNEANCMDSL